MLRFASWSGKDGEVYLKVLAYAAPCLNSPGIVVLLNLCIRRSALYLGLACYIQTFSNDRAAN